MLSTWNAFAALRTDGSVVTWGDSAWGGNSSAVASQINGTIDVTQVFGTGAAVAALRADGSVVTWGWGYDGGDSSGVATALDGTIDVTHVFITERALAALRADGSVVTWGNASYGGNPRAVASQIDGTIDVVWMADPFTNDIYTASSSPDATDDYADEANDLTAPIGILTVGSLLTGKIGASDANDTYGDKDVFKVFLGQGQIYSIYLQSTPVDGQMLPQGIFTIRDGADFNSILDTSAIGSNITETFTPDTSGYYYLRVGSGGAATDQGGYQLAVNNVSSWSIASIQNRVAEDSGSVAFTITRPSASGSKTVYVSTTAVEGFANQADYTPKLDQVLIFADGVRSMPVTVILTPDAVAEPDERFGLIFQEFQDPDPNVHLAKQTSTILNDDTAGWSISPASAVVGESNGAITFTITRPAGSLTQTVYIDLPNSLSQGDYVSPQNNGVTFAAGETAQPVTIKIINDAIAEEMESFTLVVLQSPSDDLSSSRASTRFTILDDKFIPGLDPGTATADMIFKERDFRSELNFLAKMSEAAYHLRGDEPKGNSLNDREHSENASDEFQTIDRYLDLLTSTDLPGLGLVNAGGDFAYTGIQNGIYTNQNASALVGRSEDALFISFRGTNDVPGLLDILASLTGGGTPDSDHWADLPILNGLGLPSQDEGMSEHYALFAPLLSAIDAYINNPTNGIERIYVTGHSLGAAMVQAYIDQHSGDPRFEAITFADPGYEGFDGLALNFTDPRIKTLRIENDPILMGDLVNPKGGDSYFISNVGSSFEP